MVASRDRKLAEKIRNLRMLLGASQEQFADMLKADRAQVSRWEKGTGKPSNEKLLALGDLADAVLTRFDKEVPSEEQQLPLHKLSEHPDSDWFWEKAGVNLKAIQARLLRKMVSEGDESTQSKVIRVPRLESAALLRLVNKVPRDLAAEKADSISFPSPFVSDPSSTICIQAADRMGRQPLLAGDLALVQLLSDNRDEQSRDELPFQGLALLLDRLVAVFYENLPVLRELSPAGARFAVRGRTLTDRDRAEQELNRERDPRVRAERDKKNEELGRKCGKEAAAPGVLFGKLRVQSDESWDGDFNYLSGGRPWRLVLDCGSTWNGLTDWSVEKFPFDETLTPRPESGIHVLGAVIGWLDAPAQTAPNSAEQEIKRRPVEE